MLRPKLELLERETIERIVAEAYEHFFLLVDECSESGVSAASICQIGITLAYYLYLAEYYITSTWFEEMVPSPHWQLYALVGREPIVPRQHR